MRRMNQGNPVTKLKQPILLVVFGVLAVSAGIGFVSVSYSNTITPEGIIIHHSSTLPPLVQLFGATRERLTWDLDTWDEFHQERGFKIFYWGRVYHIGYHYLILPDGTIKQGRPERCLGAHARGFNSYLGIVLVGDFSSRHNPAGQNGPMQPTVQQMHSLVVLCRQLRDRYHIPSNRILRHRDVTRTECPGDRFPFSELVGQLQ